MAIKIISNRKLDLTDDEYTYYQNICKSYDKSNFKGESLFTDLFESNENGIITFIRPPSIRHTSLEIFLFICAIHQHQHIRLMHAKFDEACAKYEALSAKLEQKLKELK